MADLDGQRREPISLVIRTSVCIDLDRTLTINPSRPLLLEWTFAPRKGDE